MLFIREIEPVHLIFPCAPPTILLGLIWIQYIHSLTGFEVGLFTGDDISAVNSNDDANPFLKRIGDPDLIALAWVGNNVTSVVLSFF